MNNVKTILAVIVLVVVIIALLPMMSNVREQAAIIIGITGDTATMMTNDGHVWQYDVDDVHVGDAVVMSIFDNDTAEVGDDIIIDVETM